MSTKPIAVATVGNVALVFEEVPPVPPPETIATFKFPFASPCKPTVAPFATVGGVVLYVTLVVELKEPVTKRRPLVSSCRSPRVPLVKVGSV